jgi:hypothetical protein
MSDYPKFPEARRRGLIPEATTFPDYVKTWEARRPARIPKQEPELDPIDDLLERAEHVSSPERASALAQAATVLAIREWTGQLRISNRIAIMNTEHAFAHDLSTEDKIVLGALREEVGL